MKKRPLIMLLLMSFTLFFFLLFVMEVDSFARAGGGRSSVGSRGSRTYSAPSKPAPGPSQSTASPTRPQAQPTQQPGGFFSRMGGGLMGGIMGGLLGGFLFRSLGFGGMGGWGGGGIGIFEIVLIAFILYMVYRFVKRRREQASSNAYYQSTPGMAGPAYGTQSYGPSYDQGSGQEQPSPRTDLDGGLRYIRQMDPSFDEGRFQDACMDIFFKIQGAWTNRDLGPIRALLTDEMHGIMLSDIEKMRRERTINKLDNIAVRSVDITEAWQETGRDFITVRFYANLLDYTVDETSNAVVSGSKTDPVKFEEYWTFARPVGNNVWQLSAIQQVG